MCKLIAKAGLNQASEDGGPAILFDDYQDVPEDSLFQEVINAGLIAIPPGITVIFLSRCFNTIRGHNPREQSPWLRSDRRALVDFAV